MFSKVFHGSLAFDPGCNLATLTRGAAAMLLVLAGLPWISQPISAADGKLVNLSTRALVGTGEEVMIGGFIVQGGTRQVLIQAVGPELADRGISNALADPVLTVIQTSEGEPPRTKLNPPIELMVNDNWEDSQRQLVFVLWGGNPTLTEGSLSAAAVLALEPGSIRPRWKERMELQELPLWRFMGSSIWLGWIPPAAGWSISRRAPWWERERR